MLRSAGMFLKKMPAGTSAATFSKYIAQDFWFQEEHLDSTDRSVNKQFWNKMKTLVTILFYICCAAKMRIDALEIKAYNSKEVALSSSALPFPLPLWIELKFKFFLCIGMVSVYEKQAVPVHVDGSPREQYHPSTPKRRRPNRRVPVWRDPRKILFAFAAL